LVIRGVPYAYPTSQTEVKDRLHSGLIAMIPTNVQEVSRFFFANYVLLCSSIVPSDPQVVHRPAAIERHTNTAFGCGRSRMMCSSTSEQFSSS
jgi:hypothetical protein